MASIVGKVIDKRTGEQVPARVHVLTSCGSFASPKEAILKVGPGMSFFYCDGQFEVQVPGGPTEILVERGTEYVPTRLALEVPAHGSVSQDLEIARWTELSDQGWHSGNTHIHYDDCERRPDQRLRLDPKVEDLRVTVVSILQRKGEAALKNLYPPRPPHDLRMEEAVAAAEATVRHKEQLAATNKYPVGMLTEFCTAHHFVECGEESRHNSAQDMLEDGFGHVMLLRIKNIIEPVSRGYLLDIACPDYPPLSYVCDETHRQGGVVIWCHNGLGIEAPVAAALGKLDALNLFDPCWFDIEYEVWYAMLNCGIRLPASTGSDWFICSGNRVYAYTGSSFAYDEWIEALRAGRTFITNGPVLFLRVNDEMPGATVDVKPGSEVAVRVSWTSHYPVQRVEIIQNGRVVASHPSAACSTRGELEAALPVIADGWIAARLRSAARDSYSQQLWAHTSPVYLKTGVKAREQIEAAVKLERSIDSSLGLVETRYKFQSDTQRKEVLELFKLGGDVYRALQRPNA